MKLVVIIPALNEERSVGDVTRRIPEDIPGIAAREVIVVDDGSIDATARVAREAGAVVISNGRNRGLGYTFARGIDEALRRGADVIVNMDADGQFRPEDIPTLIEPIVSGRAEFVTCTRFQKKEWIPKMPLMKRWGNKQMCRLVNFVIRPEKKFTDVSCGFRAYAREAAMRLNLFGQFTYTQESFIDLASKDVKMVEVPLRVRGVREFGQSRIARNLFTYARNAGMIILRSARDLHPLRFFGAIGAGLFALGAGMEIFMLIHMLRNHGRTTPYKSVLLAGGVALILSFLLFVLALLADMTGTLRKNLERIRLMLKQEALDRAQEGRRDGKSE